MDHHPEGRGDIQWGKQMGSDQERAHPTQGQQRTN